jgi:hypothetical protein
MSLNKGQDRIFNLIEGNVLTGGVQLSKWPIGYPRFIFT